ncbi:MAG: truB [Herbaspirillum sp.]|jgi:tRNA pseudouridine55 synthase|nr:truB [Herbaspirillum sp.]
MAQSPIKKPRLSIHGVLLLDKPVGFSSNDALIKAKRLLSAKKAGHTGTLDPFATGLLPLCFGEATKFSQDLLEADKSYETVVHLGVRTSTGDTEGEVTGRSDAYPTLAQIESVLTAFRGPIAQIPPMHSALKRDGKPLYEYARAGITLEREARHITIHELTLLDYAAPYLKLRVRCSKGTYIRVLGEDIGSALGCGAHLNALRRIGVGDLTLDGCITLETLAACPEADRTSLLMPVDGLLSSFPAIRLPALLAQRFAHGQRLSLGKEGLPLPDPAPQPGDRVRVYDQDSGQLLGTGLIKEFVVLAPERLVAFV